jgi:hypothetical protein
MDEIKVKEKAWVKNDIEYLTMADPTDKWGQKYGLEVTIKFKPSFFIYPHFTFMMITQLCYLKAPLFKENSIGPNQKLKLKVWRTDM